MVNIKKKLKLWFCLMATVMCIFTTMYIDNQKVYAYALPYEYSNFEILEWILIQFGVTCSFNTDISIDGMSQEKKESFFQAVYSDVFNTLRFWYEDNTKGNDEFFKSVWKDYSELRTELISTIESGIDGTVEISQELTEALKDYFAEK